MLRLPSCFHECSGGLFTVVTLLVVLQLFGENAHAQYLTGAVSRGTGGAGRAGAEQSEVTLLNPATLAHAKGVSAAFFFQDGLQSAENFENYFGLNVIDNNPNALFPGAFSYVQGYRTQKGEPSLRDEYFNVTIGNFVWGQLALGASAIYMRTKDEDEEEYEQWDGVVGLHYNPVEFLGLALTYAHFANPSARVPDRVRLLPQWSLGVTYLESDLIRLRFDLSRPDRFNPDGLWITQFGLESRVHRFLMLRFGYEQDDFRRRSRPGMGLSFLGPQFHLDYALQNELGGDRGTFHSLDLRMPY